MRSCMIAWLGLVLGLVTAAGLRAEDRPKPPDRPNILWITCEDLSPVLGCYGDKLAVTPNLDRLAREGVRYTNAYATASVCSPARSTLITGMYATSLGTQHLRAVLPLPEGVRPFPVYLRQAGYYCTNNVKEDYQFVTPQETWDESSTKAHWRNRKAGQPFFSVFNIMTTHQSRIRYAEEKVPELARLKPGERHDPAKMVLPPYYPDTPLVRADVARVYDLATAMDYQVGDLLGELKEDGLADDTIVFFYSDHGTGMPRHKRWLYDGGLRVPLIVRFPEKYKQLAPAKPGQTTDRLVSFVDFAPTVLGLAGLKPPGIMQGQAFLGPHAREPRKYVFAAADRVDEVYDMSRAVSDGRYLFILNFMPHRPAMQKSTFSEITDTRKELRRLAAQGKLTGAAKHLMSPNKPPVELYDTQTDPHNVHNLAESPAHRDTSTRLFGALSDTMIDVRDTGFLPEPEMLRRSAGQSPYTMARTPGQFPLKDALSAALVVGGGTGERARLAALLGDKDAGVRFWAAVGLLALGEDSRPVADQLTAALKDPCPEVRYTAAEALARLGHEKEALLVVTEGLKHDEPATRLYAAITLAALGEKARPALPQIREALANAQDAKGDWPMYFRWALGHVLENCGLDNPEGRKLP